MSRQLCAQALRPVLQLLDAPRPLLAASPPAARRYRLALSDGADLQLGVLAAPLNHLVSGGALRRGTVVRILEYFSGVIQNQRVIIITQLEILQAEFTPIGCPMIYEANATQRIGGACSGGLGSHGPCVTPGSQQAVSNSSCFQGHGLLDSSVTPSVEPAVNNLSFGECRSSIPAQGTVAAKMQQLSLNDYQNQRFVVTVRGDAFGPSDKTYGNPMPHSNMHSTPMHVDRSHMARNETLLCITPINALNPYQARWKIKARVTAKTDLKHFVSAKGPEKVFSFDLLDAQGGEVRAICFNLQADQYFDLIEVGKVYLISEGSLKPAQKKFNPLNTDYEIFVDHRTSIEICCGDESSISMQHYNFRQIREIENMEIGAFVDLVGIVTSVGPSTIISLKDGSEAQKITLQLKDMSGRSVEIIFWGKFCDAEGQQLQLLSDSGSNPILALKGGRISDFSGRSVVTISSTQLEVNPDVPVSERLKQWYMAGGKIAPCISLSQDVSSISKIYVQKTSGHKMMSHFYHQNLTIFDDHEVNFTNHAFVGLVLLVKVPVSPEIPPDVPYEINRIALQEAIQHRTQILVLLDNISHYFYDYLVLAQSIADANCIMSAPYIQIENNILAVFPWTPEHGSTTVALDANIPKFQTPAKHPRSPGKVAFDANIPNFQTPAKRS